MCAQQAEPTPTKPKTWIDPQQYFRLALSSKRLWRCDAPGEGIAGLLDPETGVFYCVSAESLRTAWRQPSETG